MGGDGAAAGRPYKIPLVPGPTVSRDVKALHDAYPSPDLSPAFADLYARTQRQLRRVLHARDDITPVVQIGEGLMSLWGAMKSVVHFRPISVTSGGTVSAAFRRRTRVLCVANGLYGEGFADMARSLGDHLVEVHVVSFPATSAIDVSAVSAAAREFRPDVITAVHCDTPTGLLNPADVMHALGTLAVEHGALFIVDFVSSAGGAVVDITDWNVDLGCLGSQKVLGLPPTLAVTTVSLRAWERIHDVAYAGYDGLLQWEGVAQDGKIAPYTHWWQGVAALHDVLVSLNLSDMLKRHNAARQYVLERGAAMGLELFVDEPSLSSPTCTAFRVPAGVSWTTMNRKLVHEHGVGLGGGYGEFEGNVFRVGHMGYLQTDLKALQAAPFIG